MSIHAHEHLHYPRVMIRSVPLSLSPLASEDDPWNSVFVPLAQYMINAKCGETCFYNFGEVGKCTIIIGQRWRANIHSIRSEWIPNLLITCQVSLHSLHRYEICADWHCTVTPTYHEQPWFLPLSPTLDISWTEMLCLSHLFSPPPVMVLLSPTEQLELKIQCCINTKLKFSYEILFNGSSVVIFFFKK